MIDLNTTRNLKTVDEWKSYFRDMIPQLNPNWTNTSDEDLGMVLVTLISIIGDQLNFRFDMSFLESFLGSARERNNIQSILNLIGYKLKGYKTSKAEVTLKYPEEAAAPFESDYVIPRFSYVLNSKNQNIKYYTLEPLNIFAGAYGITAEFYEGEYLNDVKTTPLVDEFGRLFLTEMGKNIAENAVVVTYDNSVVLKRVDDIYLSTEQYTYQLLIDNYGRYYIQFDSSWKAYINKSAPIVINIEFLATTGSMAQVRAKYFDTLIGGSGPATLEVMNNEAAYGYQSPESIEQARLNGPRYARTMSTAITTRDFQDLILLMSNNFIDVSAVDLNYNGLPVNFITLKALKLLLMQFASPSFNTLALEYLFTAMEEIRTANLSDSTILQSLKEKYEVTGMLGLETVEATKLKLISGDYIPVLRNMAARTVDVALGPIPTPLNSWMSGREYRVNDLLIYDDIFYVCTTAHTASNFNENIANWSELDVENEYSRLYKVLGLDLMNSFGLLDLFILEDLIQQATIAMEEKNILNLEPYELVIAILTDSGILSEFQKQEITKVLDEKRLATIKYELTEPEIININIYLTAYVSSKPSLNNNVRSVIENLVKSYINSLKIGESFRLSQLMAYLHSNYPLDGLVYLTPTTTNILGTTENSKTASKLQIIRTQVKVPSVLNIEIKNI